MLTNAYHSVPVTVIIFLQFVIQIVLEIIISN